MEIKRASDKAIRRYENNFEPGHVQSSEKSPLGISSTPDSFQREMINGWDSLATPLGESNASRRQSRTGQTDNNLRQPADQQETESRTTTNNLKQPSDQQQTQTRENQNNLKQPADQQQTKTREDGNNLKQP